MLGSDHAPHTLEEKSKTYPASPSGMTGVQTLVPNPVRGDVVGRVIRPAMTRSPKILSPLAVACSATMSGGITTPALAHHSNAMYGDTVTEFKQVTITKFAWANPHTLISFDAKDAKDREESGKVRVSSRRLLRIMFI